MIRLYATRFALLAALAGPAAAQLHLITGSPAPKAPTGHVSALFRLTADNKLVKVEDLVTHETGSDWIAASPDFRKAVLAPKLSGQPVVVVGFDKAAAIKKCVEPEVNLFLVGRWLVDLPDRGMAYAEFLSGGNKVQMRAMLLNPSVPCEQSFFTMDPADVMYVVASGEAGIAGAGGNDSMMVALLGDGSLARFFGHELSAQFPYRVPAAMFGDLAQRYAFLVANNERLFLLSVMDPADPRTLRDLAFRKGDRTWLRTPLDDNTGSERAFGEFVAAVADARKQPNGKEESAGRPEWRKELTPTGPSMAGLFAESPFVFPGSLYLYNTITDKLYTIVTNQGDSEILLVEDGVVYYRASDRLYSANLTEQGLGPARLLATSDVIRDAHWAFIKH